MAEELQTAVLDSSETLLCFLNPDVINIEEYDKSGGLRIVTITHPLVDKEGNRLDEYSSNLIHGNKIWRPKTSNGDGCLYVIDDTREINETDNEISIKAEELAVELSDLPPEPLLTTEEVKITGEFLNQYVGDLFNLGTIATGQKFSYTGTIGIMALLREIEKQTEHEFQFRYEYNEITQKIDRFIDFLPQRGKTHTVPVELGYNTKNMSLEETEVEVAIAAAPVGAPSDTKADTVNNFHKARKEFEDMVVNTNTQIPLFVTKDEDGNPVDGPMAYPPYPKPAGQNYVTSDGSDSAANYKEITAKDGYTKIPRVALFESSEENKYNLYWLCVNKIREKQQPSVTLEANVIDISKIKDYSPELYNVGDLVPVRPPGREEYVMARVTETTKYPRNFAKDSIKLGNYQIDFFADYLNEGNRPKTAYTNI
ncbi:phage-related protein [Methanobacterium formicicum]|uniref:Phage-related protein n=1 Tax=Methanobacterium formicicum TaxID=2162 RepID=A0A089ZVI5_METFO|nr:phage tail protein [Methanobacterium formicicum]AIS32494.1 phage-related protein [Methanobacterium formicicum]